MKDHNLFFSSLSFVSSKLSSWLKPMVLTIFLVACGGDSGDKTQNPVDSADKSESVKSVGDKAPADGKATADGKSEDTLPKPTGSVVSTITGKVVADKYLSGVRVCLDLNANSLCDLASEPYAKSDSAGAYKLEIRSSHTLPADGTLYILSEQKNSLLKAIYDRDAKEVSRAIDDTNVMITPLSTFVAIKVESGLAVSEAKQVVAKTFDIDVAVMDKDPIEEATTSSGLEQQQKIRTLKKVIQLQKSIEVVTAVSTAGGAKKRGSTQSNG